MSNEKETYPYIGRKENSNDAWIFIEDDVNINVTAVCGSGKELSAKDFVTKYDTLCRMAINNKKYIHYTENGDKHE